MEFGRRMLAMRGMRALTQEELAAISGVNAAYICRIENGRQIPTMAEQAAIRKALDWSPEADALLEAAAGSPSPLPLPGGEGDRKDSGLRRNDKITEVVG